MEVVLLGTLPVEGATEAVDLVAEEGAVVQEGARSGKDVDGGGRRSERLRRRGRA